MNTQALTSTTAANIRYSAGTLHSPKFLPTEKDYFKAAHDMLDSAQSGDRIELQMYEFENAATNPNNPGAVNAPGYADQQALLPGLVAAAKRGVHVDVLLDGSKNKSNDELMNAEVIDYLKAAQKNTSNLQLQLYPAKVVNIDHVKELIHLTPNADGSYQVERALAGGSNWGDHTPANDDGGALFFGRDAVGATDIFQRDWNFASGKDTDSPAAPKNAADASVQWFVTAPKQEGGGSEGIKETKLRETKNAADVYLNQFCLSNKDLIAELTEKGSHAHVRLCPTEKNVNKPSIEAVREAGGEAMWANTTLDPVHLPGQRNHEKIDVYADAQGVATGLTMGSANDTANGLDSGHATAEQDDAVGFEAGRTRRTNHEIGVFVRRVTGGEATPEGPYSTAEFLDAALGKVQEDLRSRSLENPPSGGGPNTPGHF